MNAGRSLTKRQQRAEEALNYADSYNRADRIIDVSLSKHPRWPELLGEYWSACDFYPEIVRAMIEGPLLTDPAIRSRIMDEQERATFALLPEVVRVYRGCHQSNRHGFSWTLDRTVAEKFPFLTRYGGTGPKLLLVGEVERGHIRFLKLDRSEQEVVVPARHVRVVAEETLQKPVEP